jgi:hypothetical protein
VPKANPTNADWPEYCCIQGEPLKRFLGIENRFRTDVLSCPVESAVPFRDKFLLPGVWSGIQLFEAALQELGIERNVSWLKERADGLLKGTTSA